METNPLLARRVIPRKERLQKALVVVLVTAIATTVTWKLTADGLICGLICIIAIGSVASSGLVAAGLIWFRKEERGTSKEQNRAVRQRIQDDRQERGWTGRIWYNVKRFLTGVIVLVGVAFVIAGFGVLALQVFTYLKTGTWRSVSVLSLAVPYFPWLSSPTSWFGLHDIVVTVLGLAPLSIAFVLIGWLVAGFGSGLRNRVTR